MAGMMVKAFKVGFRLAEAQYSRICASDAEIQIEAEAHVESLMRDEMMVEPGVVSLVTEAANA